MYRIFGSDRVRDRGVRWSARLEGEVLLDRVKGVYDIVQRASRLLHLMDGFACASHVREVLRGGPAIGPDEASVWITRGRGTVRPLVTQGLCHRSTTR